MKKQRKEWSEAWKFSARERRALLYLLPVLAVASWLVWEIARPHSDGSFAAYADAVNSESARGDGSGTTPPRTNATAPDVSNTTAPDSHADSLFAFDPNTVGYHDLCRLGFTRGEALGIVKYRERGKIFEIPEDFASCYQVSEAMYVRLYPYINIGAKYRLRADGFGGAGGTGSDRGAASRATAEPAASDWNPEPFSLDTITAPGLRRLGFSARQAEAVLKYRDMKGGLRSAAEFAECYVVSDEMFERLSPWLVFTEQAAAAVPSAPALLDINAADSAALRSVRGIGEKTVVAIMEYRRRLGGFHRAEQIAEVPGVTEQNYELIRKQIFADSADIKKIDLNFASAKVLGQHPYIQGVRLRKLLKLRQLKGGWNNLGQLLKDDIFTREEAEKLAPYLIFGTSEQ